MADLKRDFKSDEHQGYVAGEDQGLPTKKPRKDDSVNGASVCTFCAMQLLTNTQPWIHPLEKHAPVIRQLIPALHPLIPS